MDVSLESFLLDRLGSDLEPRPDSPGAVFAPSGLVGLRLITLLRRAKKSALLVIASSSREVEELSRALKTLSPDLQVRVFPAWDTLPHEQISPSSDRIGRRIQTLKAIRAWSAGDKSDPLVVLANIRAATQPLPSDLADIPELRLVVDRGDWDLTRLAKKLGEFSYSRVDLVSRRGEFALRGGLLDVFPSHLEHAVRVEFFGGKVDEIRPFSVANQRSDSTGLKEARLLPNREVLLTEDLRSRAAILAREPSLAQPMLAQLADGLVPAGMEILTGWLVDELKPLIDFMPAGAAVAVLDADRLRRRNERLIETDGEFRSASWAGLEPSPAFSSWQFLSLANIRQRALEQKRAWWNFTELPDYESGEDPDALARPNPVFAGRLNEVLEEIGKELARGFWVVATLASAGMRERFLQILAEANLAADFLESASDSRLLLALGDLPRGFSWPAKKLTVFSESEIFGYRSGSRGGYRKPFRPGVSVNAAQLSPGDYVVHSVHGIGRFVQLCTRQIKTAHGKPPIEREYVVLEYAASKRAGEPDRLYVPSDQLALITRHTGSESPALSRLGGSDWAITKARARKAVREIAVDLVKLYSARRSAKGFSFSADTVWQREMEDAFPYVETLDQLKTIEEVKADMQGASPMDRLISGDVGFGKTEVAIRAAFKAVQDGKQVAVLCPTTLLVRQHLQSFSERFAGFPVQVQALSRFQSAAASRKVLAGLISGEVDVVIGTHKILGPGVTFRDLGLVVVDEEQRFGVRHKEQLKKLKTGVDVLSMSATPIPRTLEMAITGIRDVSTLATPPEDRLPILTHVGPYSDRQVIAAVRREIIREGQVFYLHNHTVSIDRVVARLCRLIPEARVAAAHGKMSESDLEQTMIDFWERKYDILVCTTIIETGLDMANANTIIINQADRYGVSQLHQLRGRVGRGRERAYAYLFYDESKPLTELAYNRLSAIAKNNYLGSGAQIALKDLELRGAGNLLGEAQSGHIGEVGFDMYIRMVGEVLAEFRGEKPEEAKEVRIDLPLPASLPRSYLDSERLRLEVYQKLSGARDGTEAIAAELIDRYGPYPTEVENLLKLSRLRQSAQGAGLSEVTLRGRRLKLSPVSLRDSRQVRLRRLFPQAQLLGLTLSLETPEDLNPPEAPAWIEALIRDLLAD